MLGELDFYLPKSFCSTNVYGEYAEGKNSIVGFLASSRENHFLLPFSANCSRATQYRVSSRQEVMTVLEADNSK